MGDWARPHIKLGLLKVPLVIKTFDLALTWATTGLLSLQELLISLA